jgi:hypothetical protein
MMSSKLFAFALVTVAACVGSPPDGGGTTNPGGTTTNPGGGDPNPGGGNPPGNPGGTSMSLADYLDQTGHKECDQAFACMATFPAADGAFADSWDTSATACYADAATYYDPTTIQAEITAGHIVFDGVAAATCIAGIVQTTDCAGYWANGPDEPAACDTALVGNVADGGACVVDFDCATITSICDTTTNKCGPDTST